MNMYRCMYRWIDDMTQGMVKCEKRRYQQLMNNKKGFAPAKPLMLNKKLGGGNSTIFYFHSENWGNHPIWEIFCFNWVETTN